MSFWFLGLIQLLPEGLLNPLSNAVYPTAPLKASPLGNRTDRGEVDTPEELYAQL